MTKISSKQLGSAHAIIIVILVVVLVSALGFVLWKTFVDKAGQPGPQENTQVEQASETKPEETKEAADELIVKEWDVKFKIADELKTTSINYRVESDPSKDEAVYFRTKRVEELGGSCNNTPFAETMILYRHTEKPEFTPDGELLNESPINGYYYVASSPIAPCSIFNEKGEMVKEASPVETADRNALKAILRTLSAA